MNITSPTTTVNKSASALFADLTNLSNFEKLMPDNIAKFEVHDDETFLFGLKGMPEIKLRIKEKNPVNRIVLAAPSDKLSFNLTADIQEIDANSSKVTLHFSGEFNAMMAMMIKGPITKFLETLSANMVKL